MTRVINRGEQMDMTGKFCVVRTFSAGVHMGTVAYHSGREVMLTDARRLWRWRGANTINEIAIRGVDENYSRISEPVAEVLLTEAVEIIPCAKDAQANLTRTRWGK
jgi:hypothetical protein